MISDEGPLISWKTRKQSTVALPTCGAEYMSISAATQEGKYLKALMKDMLNNEMNYSFTLYCDSQSAMALSKNSIHYQRSKPIDIKFHFIRNELKKGNLRLFHIFSEENIADKFTKQLTDQKMKNLETY